jgi:MFS family permease
MAFVADQCLRHFF